MVTKSRAQLTMESQRAEGLESLNYDEAIQWLFELHAEIQADTDASSGPCLRSKFSGEYCYLDEIPDEDILNRGMWSGPCLILALEEK